MSLKNIHKFEHYDKVLKVSKARGVCISVCVYKESTEWLEYQFYAGFMVSPSGAVSTKATLLVFLAIEIIIYFGENPIYFLDQNLAYLINIAKRVTIKRFSKQNQPTLTQ